MSTDRMFLDYCPLPEKLICAHPCARALQVLICEAIKAPYTSSASVSFSETIVSIEPTLYVYPIGELRVTRMYAWHEASRTLAVWPTRDALDTAAQPAVV